MVDRDVRKDRIYPMERGGSWFKGYEYKKWENMRCFRNLIIVSDSILYNVFYCIIE